MVTLRKFNLDGEELGQFDCSQDLFVANANSQMVKDYVVAIRRNMRQWSASTLDRSMVNHSTQKPHKQKGTGRARQGRLSSPQYKGGGVVFGPMPKFNQHVRINKRERRAATRYVLGQYVQDEKLFVLQDPIMSAPKTKLVDQFIRKLQLQGRVLFVVENFYDEVELGGVKLRRDVRRDKYDSFKKSQSNIPQTAVCTLSDLNAYQLLKAEVVILTESAAQQFVDAQSLEVSNV